MGRSQIVNGALTALCLVLSSCSADITASSDATSSSSQAFSANDVLSDAELGDSSSLSVAQIQAFLENNYCGTRSYLADYKSGGKSAADFIHEASVANQINPIELLVRIQMESSLICYGNASDMDKALGCGCPDGASCSQQQAGFGRQVHCAASWLRGYLDDIESKGYTVSGWAPHKTKDSSEGIPVTPENAATAALYTYTPWVGDSGVGNHSHWLRWQEISAFLSYKPNAKQPDSKPEPGTDSPSGSKLGCSKDAECNHGAKSTGVVCANSGPGAGTCVDGCHSSDDCPAGGSCDQTAAPNWKCSNALLPLSSACTGDVDCNGGGQGTGRVCGSDSKTCILGCHDEKDCASGAVCDRSQSTWTCITRKEIGEDCSDDVDCSGGIKGTQRVCGNENTCIDACHVNDDCSAGFQCSHQTSPHWSCQHVSDTKEPSKNCRNEESECPVIAFPSGVRFQTKPDALLSESYVDRVGNTDAAPLCFIDVDDLFDPQTCETYSYEQVKVSDHFMLRELVGTEVDQGFSRRVLLTADLVKSVEAFRLAVGFAFTPISGYRSPVHQEHVCRYEACDNGASWCDRCARRSQHMFGNAIDLSYDPFYTHAYAQMACDAGFTYVWLEGDHVHADTDGSGSCTMQ